MPTCGVLKDYHIVFSPREHHDAIIPGVPPVPMKFQHHVTVPVPLCMGPFGAFTGKPAPTVMTAGFARTLQRGTDVGPGIPHLGIGPAAPNLLYPVIMIGSGSKSEFGVASVQAGGDIIAIACLGALGAPYLNLNLNCWSFPSPPLPSGMVIVYNTVVVDASWFDLMCGALMMIGDMAIQWGIGAIFNGLGRLFTKVLPLGFLAGLAEGGFFAQMLRVTVQKAPETLAGLLAGSPLGLSAVNVPQKWFPGLPDWLSPAGAIPNMWVKPLEELQKHHDNPAVDEHPSQPPPSPPPPAPPPPAPATPAPAPPTPAPAPPTPAPAPPVQPPPPPPPTPKPIQ